MSRIPLRLATPADADDIAALFSASRELLEFLPQLHTPAEDRGFIEGHVLPNYRVTVAEQDGTIVGFMADEPGWINHLYVAPEVLRLGIGSALLADVKARNAALDLWCFAQNLRARAFYEKHGFVAVESTDGSGNEERCPDVRYHWSAA